MFILHYRRCRVQMCSTQSRFPSTAAQRVCHKIHVSTNLVEGSGSGEDDVGVVHLDGPLSKPHQVRSDTYGSTCDLEEKTSITASKKSSHTPAFHLIIVH